MGNKDILTAESVRVKRDEWSQINISNFAKKMKAVNTLEAENCSESYHQEQKRRDGSDYYLHPVRVLKIFIYYTVYKYGMSYDDKVGAGILLHDAGEDVSEKIISEINEKYGLPTSYYVNAVTRREGESNARYLARVFQIDATVMIKLCDNLDNLLGMLEEYYEDKPSATKERLSEYVEKKIEPFLKKMDSIPFNEMKYRRPIRESLSDLRALYLEAEQVIKA